MGSAIWSADPRQFESFPALQFIRFFANHLFLERRQPKWRTLKGGSRRYVEKILETLGDRVRVSCPVRRVARRGSQWEVETDSGPAECYDEVILAAHSDQALELLEAPTEAQREILSAISYQPNDVVLHTDRSLLPELRKVWASWNYRIPTRSTDRVCTSYYMNRLQALEAPEDFCVTLNMSDRIDASHVLGRFRYSHPVFTPAARGAQLRREEISGVDGLHFCGAYWGYGFHEDGLNSALAVASHFGAGL
jgi:predicted NAD/FAD-binding protein